MSEVKNELQTLESEFSDLKEVIAENIIIDDNTFEDDNLSNILDDIKKIINEF